MANIKSAKKRILTNEISRKSNKDKKSSLRTSVKNLEAAIVDGDKELATSLMTEVSKKLDSAVSSGIVHKNYVSRQKSRLQKKINQM